MSGRVVWPPAIKKLIKDRQKVFHNNNIPLWRSLRYKVQHEITERKSHSLKIKLSTSGKTTVANGGKSLTKCLPNPRKQNLSPRTGRRNPTPLLMLIFPHLMCIRYPRFYRQTTTYLSSNLTRSSSSSTF